MPRKTDGMFFELHPSPKKGNDGKPLLYARPASDRKVTMREVDNFCSHYRGMPRGQMTINMETFIDVCRHWLSDGYRIETPLGTFSPRLRLLGEHTDPAKVLGRDVMFTGIDFTPSKQFLMEVKNDNHGFRRAATPVGNAQMYDEAFMDKALNRSIVAGFTTIRQFQAASGLKYHSAQSYLESLCQGEAPRLRRQKIGTTFHYFLLEENNPK